MKSYGFFWGGRVLENQATGVSGELEFEGIVRIVPSFSEKKIMIRKDPNDKVSVVKLQQFMTIVSCLSPERKGLRLEISAVVWVEAGEGLATTQGPSNNGSQPFTSTVSGMISQVRMAM